MSTRGASGFSATQRPEGFNLPPRAVRRGGSLGKPSSKVLPLCDSNPAHNTSRNDGHNHPSQLIHWLSVLQGMSERLRASSTACTRRRTLSLA